MFLFVEVVHDGREDGRLDLSHLGGRIFLSQDLVESAQAASEGRVEVVFDVVVGAEWGKGYRPMKFREMSFHRLPCILWSSKSCSSSSLVQGFLLTAGLRWLYHRSRHCLPVRLVML